MATLEIIEKKNTRTSLCKKQKKASTRVDLTPMVDLGFLLITFFVFTTTISQSTSMNLNMPKDSETNPTKIPQTGAMTLLMGKDDLIHYYFGMNTGQIHQTTYKEVRELILEKKRNTPPEKLFLIIKAGDEASYKNVVDILDEMNIDNISRYAVTDPSEVELKALSKK